MYLSVSWLITSYLLLRRHQGQYILYQRLCPLGQAGVYQSSTASFLSLACSGLLCSSNHTIRKRIRQAPRLAAQRIPSLKLYSIVWKSHRLIKSKKFCTFKSDQKENCEATVKPAYHKQYNDRCVSSETVSAQTASNVLQMKISLHCWRSCFHPFPGAGIPGAFTSGLLGWLAHRRQWVGAFIATLLAMPSRSFRVCLNYFILVLFWSRTP